MHEVRPRRCSWGKPHLVWMPPAERDQEMAAGAPGVHGTRRDGHSLLSPASPSSWPWAGLSESRRPWHWFYDRKGRWPHPQTLSLRSTQETSLEPSQLSAKPHTGPWVLANPMLLCPTLHTLRRNALSPPGSGLRRHRLWARS